MKTCKIDGCTHDARNNGVCQIHGAKKNECTYPDGCKKGARRNGLCHRHRNYVAPLTECNEVIIKPIIKYTCSICNKEYTREFYYKLHIEQCAKKFVCKICQEIFTDMALYKLHVKKHENRIYTCDICGITCNRKDNLTKHVKKYH